MNYFSTQRVITWTILLLILLNLSTLALLWLARFQKPAVPPPKDGDRATEQFLQQELGLTDEQARQFEELRQQHFEQSKPVVDAMQQLKRELLEEVFASAPDQETMQNLAAEIGTNQAALETLRYRHFLELKSLCQPDQAQKFRALFHEIYPPEAHPDPARPPQSPGGQPGQRPQPPQGAIAACQGQNQGNTCQFTGHHGSMTGVCQWLGNQLACVPEGNRPAGRRQNPE